MTEKDRPRILHVISALERGGAERQLQILVNNISEDYDNAILFLHEGSGRHSIRPDVKLVKLTRGSKWNIPSLWFRIFRQVIEYNPDILHLWLPPLLTVPAALAGRCKGIAILSSQRGSLKRFRGILQFPRRLRYKLHYLCHFLSSRIVSNFAIESEPLLLRMLFKTKRGIVIPNAICVQKDTDAPSELLDFPDKSFLIWTTSRIDTNKRLDLLIDSIIQLRREGLDLSLVICGEGSLKLERKLRARVRNAGAERYIKFLGYRNDWHALAQTADLFVLPSSSEGCPNVLLEAMSLGIACAATDIPGVRNIATHGRELWLVKPGCRKAMVRTLRELHKSPSTRKNLAKQGQKRSKTFSTTAMIDSFRRLYEDFLAAERIPKSNAAGCTETKLWL